MIENEVVDSKLEKFKTLEKENGEVIIYNGHPIDLVDKDEAMKYFDDTVELDAETDRKLLRKIDLYVCPLLCILYCCQFMDKTTTSYASIMGLRTDLKMVGDQYSWTGSAFYLGYLFFEFPASMCLQRFPVVKTLGAFIIIWGVILCLHATPNYAGFVALRTLLGMFESAITPAFVLITAQWYKKEEQFLRTSIWFAFNGFGSIMGASIAYGLAIKADVYSIEVWKILYIVVGLFTIALGIILVLHLPDVPSKAWFLTELERKQVIARIKSNQQGFGNTHFKMYQFIEAFKDPRTYLVFIEAIAANIPNGGLTNFSSILMKEDFGYGTLDALLMGMPVGAVELIGCTLFGLLSLWVPHRLGIATFVMLLTDAFFCIFAFASNKKARLASYYLVTLYPVSMICLLACFSANTAGHTKKITVNAIYLIGYCVGNLVGPQTFRDNQAPSYSGAKIAMIVGNCVATVCIMALYYINWKDNKRRDREEEKLIKESHLDQIENIEFADLTDFENPYFRYIL